MLQHSDRLSRIAVFVSGMVEEETLKVQDQITEVPELRSTLEEADDRLFLHINNDVDNGNVESLLITPSDTDVFVCAIY